jgi:anti-anti-sigma factor
MMENQNSDGHFILALAGRIDAITAQDVESNILSAINEHKNVILDFNNVDYVSSAGLRVLLVTHKHAQSIGGCQTLENICADVMEVFEMTGFANVLNLKKNA